ncbi:MAG: hypothetical protein JWP36_2321 [Paucimonas sp.]|nr:hypothetical protein [Paucimonas sp.]
MKHAALAAWMRSRDLKPGAPRPDGATLLVFDNSIRVLCHPASRGDVVFEYKLFELPASRREQEELLEQVAGLAYSRLAAQQETLVLASDAPVLLLQQRVGAGASQREFEAALENFLNAIDDWRRLLDLAPHGGG